MSYRVGIDFGTTFTAAAVHRHVERTVELVPLGENGTSTPSVIFVAPDGSLLVGDAAVRRAVTDPDRVVREVKRRIGDPTPVLVAGQPIGAHTLAARFIRWVVDRVVEREGTEPVGVAVSHPASWGPHKRALLAEAIAAEGLADVELVTEPEAAAVAYTASEHVEPGAAIAVYDLGGGTFDAAVVRQLDDGGFELAGRPEGIDALGGIDFDEAVFEQVRAHLGHRWSALDFGDPMVVTAAAALRRECTEAKKALSSDTEVTIPVMLPGVSTNVRMVRAEFEQLIGPAIDATVDALRVATASAGLRPADLSAVLLVGGSSRIPLVAQRVSAELDLPVTVDSDPKAVVAIGAALSIAPAAEAATATRIVATEPPDEPRRSRRVVSVLVGLAACAVALVVLAGTVGIDILPTGGSAAEGDVAAPATGGSSAGAPTSGDGTDPWTGEPYTETTAPGPTRPDAEPTDASPASLAPAPTKSANRAALIAGKPPAPPPGGSTGTPTGGATPTGGPPVDPPDDTVVVDPPDDTGVVDPPDDTGVVDPPDDTGVVDPPDETTTGDPPPADPPPAGEDPGTT